MTEPFAKQVLKPSQVMRMVKAGKIADPQPRGVARIRCEAKRHTIVGATESPTFWETGMYVWCTECGRLALARPDFGTFEIDLTGERKSYPWYSETQWSKTLTPAAKRATAT